MKGYAYILILFAAGILASCRDNNVDEAFTLNDTVRMEYNGAVLFTYSPLTCQLFFNRDSRTFRAGTDNMSDYFSLTLSDIPKSGTDVVNGDIWWSSGMNVANITNITLRVVKLEGDKIWLWAAKERIGLVVRVLD